MLIVARRGAFPDQGVGRERGGGYKGRVLIPLSWPVILAAPSTPGGALLVTQS